ncbi:hypothetical protein ID866_11716 [Astraeus odoratus]|nr:hypothetical protein ID866_11716 [Astraeus odoratus]
MAHSRSDLFEYTSGRWILNDALRHAERRRVFNVDGLCRLAAQSVDRSPDDIVDFEKLAEGGFNRIFLITMRGGFQMVARVPYPAMVPKYYAIASEVATMAMLRSFGLPIPKVYGYSPASDNAAETEYIFMEFVQGTNLSDRVRREGYRYQEQSPSDHIENLDRYLLIASSLVPRDPSLGGFCIRHPDLQPSNIVVSKSPDSNWQVVGLFDWQHTSILPPFLLASIPERLQNYDDPISQSLTQFSLPENLDDLSEAQQSRAKELHRRRLIHYHYVKNTEEWNVLHYVALTDPVGALRRRLFQYAGDPWEGETLPLKVALIEATESWETLTGGGTPCPVVFDAEDVRETMKLDAFQKRSDRNLEMCRNIIGFGPEGWVPTEYYEEAMTRSKWVKEKALAAAKSAEERAEIAAHWPFDDMDEEKYT